MPSFFLGFGDELEKIAKSFPISRAMTSSLNPIGLFGAKRFVGSRGLMDRLAIGTVTGQDHRSIRRILMAKRNLSTEQAGKAADKILAKARAGGFSREKGGKEYFVSGALSGRRYSGAAGAVHGALDAPTFGMSRVTGALAGSGGGIATTQFWRALGPRGLAGRITKGKALTGSEQKLMKMLSPSRKQKVLEEAQKMGGAAVTKVKSALAA